MLSDFEQQNHTPQKWSGYVVGVDDVSSDVRAVMVRLDHDAVLPFLAGQYAIVQFGDLDARPYSIASSPEGGDIVFHIKNTGYGVSAYVADFLKPGDVVRLEAPFGRHHLRLSDRPVLAVAGGLGVAPIKSIVESSLVKQPATPVHLYYGTVRAQDLYLDQHFLDLARKHTPLHFMGVVEQNTDIDRYSVGRVADVALADFDDLSGFDLYISGPLKMAESAIKGAMDRGADLEHIFSDALDVLGIEG